MSDFFITMERRKSVRVAWGAEVSVRLGAGEVMGTVMNISEHGMFIRGDRRSPMSGLRLMTAFKDASAIVFALARGGGDVNMHAVGVVAWMSDLGVGIDFREIDDEMIAFIRALNDDPGTAKGIVASIVASPVPRIERDSDASS